MAKVEISVPGERIVEEFTALVPQPTVPSTARPPDIGLVEVSHVNPTELIPGPPGPPGPRGSRWTTGDGDPSSTTGNVLGDMYLDDVTGDIWTWNGSVWVNTGTNLSPSGQNLLDEILLVDGAGSLLDADLLDGQHGVWYQDRANHTGTQAISTVSGLQPALDLKAPLASPALTGNPTAPTPTAGDADTSIATTAFVSSAITADITTWAEITGKPSTFPPTVPISQSDVTNLVADLALKAPIASPTFTGDPKAPTPATADNDTSIATTAYVKANLATIVGGAIVSDTAPGSPQAGQLWYESDTGNTHIYVTDADSSQWVQQNVMPSGGASDNLSTAADMSIGFRTSGNRFVVNDKADMSGTDVMTVSEAGSVTVNGAITANSGAVSGFFIGGTTNVAIGPSTAGGTIFLRPVAYNSATGQTTIDSSGYMTVNGTITSTSTITGLTYFASSTVNAIFGPASGGSFIYLRPVASASTTGQTSIDSAGVMTVAGGVGSNGIFGNSAGGIVYLRPNGVASATNQATIDTSGNMTVGADYHATGANTGTRVSPGIVRTSANVNTIFAHRQFYNPSGAVGQITTTNAATAYATSSSADLKDVHGDYDPQEAIAVIRADPVKAFTWKVAGGGDAIGWTAQHSHSVKEDLAIHTAAKAAAREDEEDEPEWWGIDYGRRTPYLWAALTNALDRIDQLEARLAALEGGAS